MAEEKKRRTFECTTLILLLLFYLFWALYDGAVICVDSESYITMSLAREFFYPLFLAILRGIFGANNFLLMAAIIQSILQGYVVWNVTVYLRKQFSLNMLYTGMVILIQIAVSLLNRFVALRGSMYSNSIMTESICIPLFILFIRYIHEYVVDKKRRSIIIACFLSFIMISTRKQMYVTIVLILVVWIVKHYKAWKKLVLGLIIAMAIIVGSKACDKLYNYFVHGSFVGHVNDSRFVLTMMMYTSEREYVDKLPQELQPLFLAIYDICDEKGYLMHSCDRGWLNEVSHFGDHYDNIQIDTMHPMIVEYANTLSDEPVDQQKITDQITNTMIVSLAPTCAFKILHCIWNNFLSGLVTTVAQRKSILIAYSFVIYALYVILLIYHICKSKKKGKIDAVTWFAILTALAIVSNVGLVSMVIFCQTRYTIYNMALFYIAGLLMLVKRKDTEKIVTE